MTLVYIVAGLFALLILKRYFVGDKQTQSAIQESAGAAIRRICAAQGLCAVEMKNEVINRGTGYKQVRREVQVLPTIRSISPTEIILQMPHQVRKQQVYETLRGMGIELHRAGVTSHPTILVEPTGYANEYRYRVVSDSDLRIYRLLLDAGLYSKDDGAENVPSFKIDDDGIISLDCAEVRVTREQIEKAIPFLNTLGEHQYDKNFLEYDVLTKRYTIFPLRRRALDFDKPIDQLMNKYMSEVIAPMRTYFAKEHQMLWYLGEVADANLDIGASHLFEPLDASPHAFIAGATGSGKSESAITMLTTLAIAHPEDVEVLVANGMDSTDLDSLATYLSSRPVAYNGENLGKPALCYLNDLLLQVRTEAQRRAEEFRLKSAECGKEIVKIQQYRKYGYRMREIFVFIDEFRAYMPYIDYSNNKSKENTVAFLIQKILAEYRKYGVHLVLATQKARAADVPKDLIDNLGLKLIHRIEPDMQNYLEGIGMSFGAFSPSAIQKDNENTQFADSNRGRFILPTSGYTCKRTGGNIIPAKMPYLSFNRIAFYESLGFTKQTHTPWDDSIILDIDNVDPTNVIDLHNRFKKAFYSHLSSTDIYSISEITSTFCFSEVKIGDKKVGFGYVHPDECTPENAAKLHQYKLDAYVWVLTTEKDVIDQRKIKSLVEACPWLDIWALGKYRKEITRNLISANEGRATDTWFSDELTKLVQAQAEASAKPGDLTTTEMPKLEKEDGKLKINGITSKELTRISQLKGNTDSQKQKKGKLLELFIAELLRAQGHANVVVGAELKGKYIPPQRGDADYGLDLVIDTPNGLVIAQIKNYSGLVGNQAIQQVVAAKAIVEGFLKTQNSIKRVTETWVFATNGYTEPARTQAEYSNVKLVDMQLLQTWVREVEKKKPETRGRKKKEAA